MLEPRKQAVPHEIALASEKFDQFCAASSLKTILGHFRELCDLLSIKPTVFSSFYPKLKSKLRSWKAQALWAKFDKRASHKCYNRGKASPNTRVLIIGAGPCGLRTAIEAQLLGAKVVVVEKRDRITRHNVLHLWPFVIHDLRALGAKKFFGKFCAGSIDHISIRQLQFILLKVALILGVEVHEGVGFEGLVEPPEDQSIERTGWRANVTPADHPVSQYEFDVLIGADGKRNTLDGFKRKEFRGKLAIAITANFINRHSEAEARVEEISGVAFIFNQKFFKDLYAETGIDLENIVYYKDETHYFVMTAKKQSLIDKGVILNDYAETAKLLAVENVNKDALQEYARQAADFSTNYRLPQLEFALNHYGQPDVAMFDFTSMFAAENASRVIERRGHRLLQILVGDSLLEPFWPTGSGCARGFLSSMDACWAVRSWGSGHSTPLEVIAERESIYRLLGQTTPENLQRDFANYTLDPHTRYPNLNTRAVLPIQVRGLYDSDDPTSLEQLSYNTIEHDLPKKRRRKDSQVHPDTLLHWLKKQVALYSDLHVENMTDSFKNGLILCAIIHRYRPDLIDFHSLKPEDVSANNQLAFDTLERELGIPPVMTGKEMEQCDVPDKLTMLSYLSQIYDTFRGEIPHIKHPKLEVEPEDIPAAPRAIKFRHLQQLTPAQKVNLIGHISNAQHHNRSTVSRKRFSSDRDLLTGAGTPYGIGSERKTETSRKSRSKRRSLEKGRQSGDEEREKRLEEIRQNRLERERRRKYLRKLTTLQFYKSMQMLQTNARYENSQPFEDYSIFLYRQTAPSFEERVKDLERKLYYPDRDVRLLSDIKRGGAGEDMSGRIKTLEEKLRGTTHTEKKPKDLLRAIGKIEKSDWNVMELEKKIQENKMGKGGRQDNPEKVPKWSRDQFVDKFEAVKSKLETKTVDREKEKNDKYSEVDVTLKLIGKKLKEGNALEAGPRGSNKVSAMAEQFAVKTQDTEKPSIQRSNSKAALILPAQGGSEMCHFCKKRVYLMERLSIEGRFFHRGCFRCEYCGTTLRLGSHLFDRDGCRFYCTQHFGMQGVQKMRSARKDQENYTGVGKAKVHGVDAILKHTDMAPEATPEKNKLHGIDAIDQRTTPERIEFENLVTSDVEELPGEMDEDEWTDRNFGTSAAEGSSDSVSDLSDSGDDDNEVFEEAVDQPFTADETRRLAEDWTRRYSRNTPAEVQNGSISKRVGEGIREDESASLNDGDTDGDMSGKESESDEDETETATEGDEDVKARELRKQEIYLKVPERAKVQSDTDSGSNTEVQSDDTTESSDEEIENSATEIETDSEFEHDGTSFPHNIPSIIIDDRNVTKRKRYNTEEPIKVHTRAGHIHPINGTVKPLLPSVQKQQGIRLKFSSVQPETANSFTTSNLVSSKNLLNNNAKLPTSSQLAPLINPRQGNYLLNRTHSTEGIASKVSLELKKRYLLGTSDIGGTVRKSGSASTIDSKLKNFVDTISEHQKLLHPAPEPSPSMQAYLQGASRVSSSSSHFSPPSPTIIAASLQLPQVQKCALRKEKELPDVEGSFEHICGKKEAKVFPSSEAEKSSEQADHVSASEMTKDDSNAHTNEADAKLLVKTENAKDASNGLDNLIQAKVEEETDYRPRSPAHETSIVVPDMQWNLTAKTDGDNEENDDDDDDDDDDDIETDSLSSGSSSIENDPKQKSDSHSSGNLPERITPRVEIHDSSGVLMTEDVDVPSCTKQDLVVEAADTEAFSKSDAISVEKVTDKNVVIDKSVSDLVKVRHNSVNSDHSSPSTPPSRSDLSESHEHEGTFAALTETELSDWAHDGDAVVSEDLDDVEFNINPHFVTIRNHKKPRSSKNTSEKNFSPGYQKSIAKTEDLDDDSNKDKIHSQTDIPQNRNHEIKTVPCLFSDIDNIEFMDTGEENESDSDDVLAATNKTLLKNSGYVQFVDSDDVVTPVLEIPALIEQTMPVPVLPTLIVSECDDNSDENDSSPKHTLSKESAQVSKEEDDNSLQRERTSTEEMTSDTDTVKEKLPNKCTNNDSTCEDELFFTPKTDLSPKNGGDSHNCESSEQNYNNYATSLQEHIPTFSNIRDSINIVKARQKNKDSLVLQSGEAEIEQIKSAPATNSEDNSNLHLTKSPNTSRKLKEISRERSAQKDIVHKMVLDKHLPQKRSSQDRKSRKCFSGIYSPPSLAPRRTSDPTLFPPNSPEKNESLIPAGVKKLEMPTVILPSAGETDRKFNSPIESVQDLKIPLSDDSVLVTEETEQFFTPLTSFKKTSKGSRPLSYHSSFKSSHRPSKFCRSPEKYSSSLPHTPLTNPEAFSLPDITKVLFKTPDIALKPPVAPPRTKHERKVARELLKEENNRRTEFTSNDHGELHKQSINATPNLTSVGDRSVTSIKDSDISQLSMTPLRSPVSSNSPTGICGSPVSSKPSASPTSTVETLPIEQSVIASATDSRSVAKERRKSKDPERRKSLIQAVSDFFHKKKDSTGSVSPPKTPTSSNHSHSKDGKFRLKFTKAKDKMKLAYSSCSDDSDDRESPNKCAQSSDVYRIKTTDSVKEGEKRYGILYDDAPPPIPPPPLNYLKNIAAHRASEESCSEVDEESRATILSTQSHEGTSSTGSLSRRHTRMQQRMSRQAQQKRLRMAQEIQRQLEEVEVKQKELEHRGVNVEKALRGESAVAAQKDEGDLLKEWFALVRERSELRRFERELLIRAEELELEDRHSRLQQELRERLKKDDSEKTPDDVEKEGQILNEMLEIVERRDSLIALLEEDRQRYQAEDRDLEAQMLAKGLRLTPLRKESHV